MKCNSHSRRNSFPSTVSRLSSVTPIRDRGETGSRDKSEGALPMKIFKPQHISERNFNDKSKKVIERLSAGLASLSSERQNNCDALINSNLANVLSFLKKVPSVQVTRATLPFCFNLKQLSGERSHCFHESPSALALNQVSPLVYTATPLSPAELTQLACNTSNSYYFPPNFLCSFQQLQHKKKNQGNLNFPATWCVMLEYIMRT